MRLSRAVLTELVVENVALIERASVALGPGFNVLTGETGAGKSLVLDALGMVVGHRAGPDVVRAGADAARVEALFEVDPSSEIGRRLEGLEWPPEDGQVVLSRELSASGRSRCRINGRPVTVGELARVGELLVDIQTQHESQRLMTPGVQLALLDAFAGESAVALAMEVGRVHEDLSQARRRLAELRARESARLREIELLRFQVDEIAAAALRAGEDEALRTEYARLSHTAQLRGLLGEALDRLGASGGDQPGALGMAAEAQHLLEQAAALDGEARELARALAQHTEGLADVARAVRRHRERCEPDPERLHEIEERLGLIDRLERKYGAGIEGVLAYRKDAQERLNSLESEDQETSELDRALALLERAYEEKSHELTRRRKEAAGRLAQAVGRELAELALPGARFEVVIASQEPGPSGCDRVDFQFSANPGEAPRPLARVASGGELSRTMLACQVVLASADAVPVLVFDEPDAGLGGRAAHAVGMRLSLLGQRRQVLAVTHLPQVASLADRHLVVRKEARGDRSVVRVVPLDPGQRVDELARMLGGSQITDSARAHAEQLLRMAAQAKGAG